MVQKITPRSRKKDTYYSDFRKDLFPNVVNSDVSRKIDEESVKESIKNLVLTDFGERPFQPNIGSDVRRQLFNNFNPQTKIAIEENIRNVIKDFEPRCNLLNVGVHSGQDENSVYITIIFSLINISDEIELVLTLDRVR